MSRFWTKEKEEELVRLWRIDVSAEIIAAQLGAASRNAVLGHVHRNRARLGLARKSTRPKPRRRRPAVRIVSRKDDHLPSLPPLNPIEKPIRRRPPKPVAAVNDGSGLAFLELKPAHCRFPLKPWPDHDPSQGRFCGQEVVDGKSYCAGHMKRITLRGYRAGQEEE